MSQKASGMTRFLKRIGLCSTPVPLAGALSGWGIFALLHHLLIQQAAYLVGSRTWFSNYAILGDDLVIGSKKVAKQYLRLLKVIGVEVSWHKSLESSNGSLEFASRFKWQGIDISPIPFELVTTARVAPVQSSMLVTRLREFREVRLTEMFRLVGARYRITGMVNVPYNQVSRLPKKWKRRWSLRLGLAGLLPVGWACKGLLSVGWAGSLDPLMFASSALSDGFRYSFRWSRTTALFLKGNVSTHSLNKRILSQK